jgi:hypothetical protein
MSCRGVSFNVSVRRWNVSTNYGLSLDLTELHNV